MQDYCKQYIELSDRMQQILDRTDHMAVRDYLPKMEWRERLAHYGAYDMFAELDAARDMLVIKHFFDMELEDFERDLYHVCKWIVRKVP